MKIPIEKIGYIVLGVHIHYTLFGKKSPYENLLEQVETYKLKNTPLDTDIHNIDDLMVDAYILYEKIKSKEEEIINMSDHFIYSNINNLFGFEIDINEVQKELGKLTDAFDYIMMECDFEGVQIKGIQKNFLNDKLKELVESEEYEKAAKIRDKINNII